MSRKKKQPAYHPVAKPAPHVQLVHKLLRLPRLGRIGLTTLFALAVTLALSPIIDSIYLRYLFTPETVLFPALASAGFGLAMYIVGWLLMIGPVGEALPARTVILWYVGVGILAVLLVLVWLITGIASGNAPTA
jgi:hypothetical protein